jgi:V8-like Glu-specific endopeptidase
MNPQETKEKVLAQFQRIFPDLDKVEDDLTKTDYSVQTRSLAKDVSSTKLISSEKSLELPVSLELMSEESAANLKSIVEIGHNALNKVRKGKKEDITPKEIVGLEAIIGLVGRPAILVNNNTFLPPPEEWRILEQHRDKIQSAFLAIGRINVVGHPALDWVGTGFLVAKDVIMTNAHVAIEFSRQNNNGGWTFRPGHSTSIDYSQDLGGNHNEFNIKEVIGIHNDLDLALMRVSSASGGGGGSGGLPKPLTISHDFDDNKLKDRNVYVVGFPAWDGRRNDPVEMQRIFLNIYGVKRLQPGTLLRLTDSNIMEHDCSTLGGNSGSCVIDLETNKIVGLHFSGRYLVSNRAVALWKLVNDSLLTNAGVQFG